MTLLSANFPNALDANVRHTYSTAYGELAGRRDDLVPIVFTEMDSQSESESGTSVSEAPLMTDLATTGSVQYASHEELWKVTATHKEWTQGLKIERKLIEDSKNAEIMRRVMGTAKAAYDTRQVHATSLVSYSFSGSNPYNSQTGGDGVALCSASHKYLPSSGATDVQGNYGTSSLTYPNVISTIKAMRALKNSRGLKAHIKPNVLVVGSNLEPEAHTIVESLGKPDSANNDINYLRFVRFSVIVLDDLEDALQNCWWMMDLEAFKLNAIWWNRVGLEVIELKEIDTMSYKWVAYDRHSFYVADWRGIYGHYVAP
jgi:hypothetical protein